MQLLLTADAVGGVWTQALDLAAGLAALGVHTTLAVLGPPPDAAQRSAAAAVPDLALHDTGLPLDWLADTPAAVEHAGAALATLAVQARVDAVQLHTPALAAGARFPVPVVAACHSCVATWWAAMRGDAPLPPDLAWRAALVRRGCAAADALLAPSHAFAAAMQRAYALPATPTVVHNGRATPPVRIIPRRTFPLPILTAGRLWDEGKNLAALDRAAARLPVPVSAAGPLTGPNGARFAPRHIQPLGVLDAADLHACLALAPVFVSVARYEPFGLAVLEAAQHGCPLVLSDIPTFRELWDGAAAFVPADDAAAIAAAIGTLSTDRVAAARGGAAAAHRAARYTMHAMAAGTLALHRAAATRRAA